MLSAQGCAGHSTGLPAPAAWRGVGAAAHGVAWVAHGPAVSGSRRRGAEDALLLFKGAMQKPNLRSAHVPLGATQVSPGVRSPQKGRETAVSPRARWESAAVRSGAGAVIGLGHASRRCRPRSLCDSHAFVSQSVGWLPAFSRV